MTTKTIADGARRFERNVPAQQEYVQGRNADRNARLSQTVRASRTIQPGNTFNRQIRKIGDDTH